jgi:hypothetical protein
MKDLKKLALELVHMGNLLQCATDNGVRAHAKKELHKIEREMLAALSIKHSRRRPGSDRRGA